MPVKPEIETRQTCQLKRKKEIKAPATMTTPEKFENATITGHFGFVFKEISD